MRTWATLFAHAARNRGVVTTACARSLGISADTLHRRVRREGWVQLFRGAYLVPGAEDTHEARCHAAILLLGERSAVSHDSALYLHALVSPPPLVHAVVPAARQARNRDGLVVHRSRLLTTADVTRVDNLPVTTVARSLRDVAAIRATGRLLDLATVAEQRRLTQLDDLAFQAERRIPARGGQRYREAVLVRTTDRSDSGLERDTRAGLLQHGLVPHPTTFPVRCPDGRVIHLDIAFAPAWAAIECDGRGFHSDPRAFEVDRLRWRLVQRVGRRLTWVTRKRLDEDLAGIVEEVRHLVATAPDRAPAVPAL